MKELQEGIFWKEKTTPGEHLGILFIKFDEDSSLERIYSLIKALSNLHSELKSGIDPYVPNAKVPNGDLTVTVGYGKNLFERFNVKKNTPQGLVQYGRLRSPKASGGGLILSGSNLPYSKKVSKNIATEDMVIQFTANTVLATKRAIVYSINLINSNEFQDIGSVSKFYTGFHRDDKRSWIGFHDGISNIKSGNERLGTISIKPSISDDVWTEGGTYLFFLRINVDIEGWNNLPLDKQEILVGRKKDSGCPITDIQDGKLIPENGCPVSGTKIITDKSSSGLYPNIEFFETPIVDNEQLKESHIQRANQHREPAKDRNSLRIFRQGYEFLEHSSESPGFKAGLNFISFQDTPERVNRILTQPTWLGNINFGGDESNQNGIDKLLEIESGGIYLVPPINNPNKVPGFELFEEKITA